MSFESSFDNPIRSKPEVVPEKENEAERPTFEILKERAEITEKGIKEISSKDKERLFGSVERVSENIPEIIIAGGTALRIYLENLGKKVPTEFGKDIDCVINKEAYEKVRDALPPQKAKESIPAHPDKPLSVMGKIGLGLSYKRKGGDFLNDPENHMALEDKKTHHHVDIFPKQEITSEVNTLNLKGQKINLLSPEELFVRRMSNIKQGIEAGELQERHVSYFYLNGGLIEETKMDKLWGKVKKIKEDVGDWREVWRDLDQGINLARSQGKIKEKIVHFNKPEEISEKSQEKILEKTLEVKPEHDQLVTEVASLTHDDWRAPRKIEGTDSYEPRIKKVEDKEWIKRHDGQKEVDIANTPYGELPKEWQAESKASAEIAIREVIKVAGGDANFDEVFIERVADLLHRGWLERNEGWAAEELKKPYPELPEAEKEKDRHFVRRAIEVYERNKKQ